MFPEKTEKRKQFGKHFGSIFWYFGILDINTFDEQKRETIREKLDFVGYFGPSIHLTEKMGNNSGNILDTFWGYFGRSIHLAEKNGKQFRNIFWVF